MNAQQVQKVTEQLEDLGYYEGDWEGSKNQKHNGFEWVYEQSIIFRNDFMLNDYKRNCDRLAGLEFISLGLGYYLI